MIYVNYRFNSLFNTGVLMEEFLLIFKNSSNGSIIAFSSLLVATCALLTTFWQVRLSRKHNKLSVKPFLSVHKVLVTGKTPIIKIINNGIGPAFINNIYLKYNGELFTLSSNDSIEYFLNSLGYPTNKLYKALCFKSKLSLSANSEVELLSFTPSKCDERFELNKRIIRELMKVNVNVEYSCIYEGNYKTSS